MLFRFPRSGTWGLMRRRPALWLTQHQNVRPQGDQKWAMGLLASPKSRIYLQDMGQQTIAKMASRSPSAGRDGQGRLRLISTKLSQLTGTRSRRNEPLIHWNSRCKVYYPPQMQVLSIYFVRNHLSTYTHTRRTIPYYIYIGCAFIIRHCFFSDFMYGCLCLCFYIVWGIIYIYIYFVCCFFLPNECILGANYIWVPTALKSIVLGIISPVMVCSIPSYRAIKTIKTPLQKSFNNLYKQLVRVLLGLAAHLIVGYMALYGIISHYTPVKRLAQYF